MRTHSSSWLTIWGALVFTCSVALIVTLHKAPNSSAAATACIIALVLLIIPVLLPLLEHFENGLFLALVFTCPLEIGKSWFYKPYDVSGPNHELRLNISIIVLTLLTMVLFWKAATGRKGLRGFRSTTFPAVLFLCVSALSCAAAPDVMLAEFELVRMATALLVYFVAANYVASGTRHPVPILIAITLNILLQSLMATFQQATATATDLAWLGLSDLSSTWGEQTLTRAGGLMGHPNSLAALILMFGSVTGVAALFLGTSKVKHLLLGVTAGLSICILIITYSRSAWVSLVLGVCITAPSSVKFYWRATSTQKRSIAILAGLLVITSCGAVSFYASTITERLTQSDAGSAHSRIEMMIDAVEVIKDNWAIGVGLNNYASTVGRYDVTGIHRGWYAIVHNLYLLIAAESGVSSLVLFTVVIGGVLRQATKVLTHYDVRPATILILGLRLGIVVFLIQATMDPAYRFYPGLQRTFWLFLGLTVGYVEAHRGKESEAVYVTRDLAQAELSGRDGHARVY